MARLFRLDGLYLQIFTRSIWVSVVAGVLGVCEDGVGLAVPRGEASGVGRLSWRGPEAPAGWFAHSYMCSRVSSAGSAAPGLGFAEIVRKSVIQGLWTRRVVRIDGARSETGWPTGLRRLCPGFWRCGELKSFLLLSVGSARFRASIKSLICRCEGFFASPVGFLRLRKLRLLELQKVQMVG